MSTATVEVTTRNCFVCGKPGTVTVPAEGFYKWNSSSEPIQECLGNVSAALREQLISGTHPECWDTLYPSDEEDE